MRKILHAFAVIALLSFIAYTFLYTAFWYNDEVCNDAAALFVVSEEFIADNFHDHARATDRVGHYQTGLEGIRFALHKRGFSFSAIVIPKDSEPLALQRLFLVELKRAAMIASSDPWPLAYAATEAMCASLHDAHTSIGRPRLILAPPVTSRILDGKLGLLSVRAFNTEYIHRFSGVVRDLETRGCIGIILDLRNSVGGDIDAMCALTSCFIPPGTPLFSIKNDYTVSLLVSSGGYQTSLPLVVLINHSSYSAAEMIAEVLRRAHRAPLIGECTAGHFGVARSWLIDQSRGVVIQVTTQTHTTFGGATLEGVGVSPDIVLVDAPTQTGGTQLDAARSELERLITSQKK